MKKHHSTLKTFNMVLLLLSFFIVFGNNISSNQVNGLISEKIIGGIEASKKQFKYIVAVIYNPREGNKSHQNPCTGAIISDTFISTIAQCFFDKTTGGFRNKEFYIRTSEVDLNNPLTSTNTIRVDLVYIPSFYDPLDLDNYSTIGNIAIVKGKKNFGIRSGHNSLKKVKIMRDHYRSLTHIYTVAGYGWNETELKIDEENFLINDIQLGQGDGLLRYAKAYILDEAVCQSIIQDNIPRGNMCVKIIQELGEHKGICKGDGGSPLVSGDFLGGIAITGFEECNENKMPGIYIDIPVYYKFIHNILDNKPIQNTRVFQLEKISESEFEFEFKEL